MTMSYATLSGAELAAACATTDDLAAWQEFVQRFQPLITRVAANVAYKWSHSSIQLVDDIVQETYLRLCADRCRLLRNFRERHPDAIFGFIKTVAASVAHDHMKTMYAAKRGGNVDEVNLVDCVEGAPPSSKGSDDMTRSILLKEVAGALQASGASGRDQVVFWLYYRDGLTAKAISCLKSLGLSTKGVESLILRLTRSVKAELGGGPKRLEVQGKSTNEGIYTA
jgi:RNA polymerase sigma factor (sigma-70 family)